MTSHCALRSCCNRSARSERWHAAGSRSTQKRATVRASVPNCSTKARLSKVESRSSRYPAINTSPSAERLRLVVLQSASNLIPVIQWQPVTNSAVIRDSDNTVTLPNLGSQRFFRLLSLTQPIDWPGFAAGPPSDTNAQSVIAILRNACKYAMTTWWTNKYATQDATYYLDLGGTDETHIRSPAMEAYGLAVALQTGIYDPALSGVSVADARGRTLKLLRSLGYRHLINQPGGWGNDWQTALWAGLAGTAGWILWTDLSASDQEYVRRMVEYEANRFTNYAVPYYMNRSGTIVYPGDTKCEENAWNSSVMHLALCMMPAHPNAAPWWNKALELSLSAHARPSDINRTNVYHG